MFKFMYMLAESKECSGCTLKSHCELLTLHMKPEDALAQMSVYILMYFEIINCILTVILFMYYGVSVK